MNLLFVDTVLNEEYIHYSIINSVTVIVMCNLLKRLINRYHNVGKKYGDDFNIWKFNEIDIDSISKELKGTCFEELLKETCELFNKKVVGGRKWLEMK